jgi:hypothetical protein
MIVNGPYRPAQFHADDRRWRVFLRKFLQLLFVSIRPGFPCVAMVVGNIRHDNPPVRLEWAECNLSWVETNVNHPFKVRLLDLNDS